MRRAFVTAAVAVGLALGAAAPAFATTDFFYPNMTQDVTHGTPDCSQNPVQACSLRDAINLANQDSNDADVFLASGTTYSLTQDVSLRTDSGAQKLTIVGNDATINASGNATQYPLVGGQPFNAGNSLELDSVTLTGTPGPSWVVFDGAGNLTLDSVTFSGNASNTAGPAGLDIREVGTLTMTSDRFTANRGDSSGGANFLAGMDLKGVQTSATLVDVTFDNNLGDALLAEFNNGPISLQNLRILSNSNIADSALEVDAMSAPAALGGIDVEGNASVPTGFSAPTVVLRGNFSQLDGVTIANNTVDRSGAGAALAPTATVTANNWTVTGNQVQSGGGTVPVAGGIDVGSGTLRLNHATVTNNSAAGNADDLHTSGTGSIVVLNSIVQGSRAGGAVPCAADGGPITSGGHNIDLSTSCGIVGPGDLNKINPRLGQLTTGLLENYQPLLYGSPAVDAADSANCPPTDIAGTPRPQGVACDIGAYEARLIDLSVALHSSPKHLRHAGGKVTYTATVSNSSTVIPPDVQLTDTLPKGSAFVSASTTAGSCALHGKVICALGSVRRGANVTVRIVAKLKRPGRDVNRVHVQSEVPDSNMRNDNATAATSVKGRLVSGLHLNPSRFSVKSGGTTITYSDSASGRATLTFFRKSNGKLHRVGSVARHDIKGHNSVHFSGRLGNHALSPGTYVVAVTPAGGAGESATFTVT